MSYENVEIVRRAIEAAIQTPKPDFATINALFHPDHELVSLTTLRGPAMRGAHGFREWLTNTGDAFESWQARVEEARAIDKTRVLVVATFTIEGRGSGIPYDQQMGMVMTVRGGKIIRTETYSSPDEALEALGLRD
jgi:ketosteroid isomerase-like protein